MSVATYTKTGNKATAAAKLDKSVFAVEVKNHNLLKQAYLAYLANSRANLAVTKKRGEVRGGGRKPWRQKGTGRARAGSSRSPLWRGGGITFGPTGTENYTIKLTKQTRKIAVRQALSLAASTEKIKVIETFETKTGKVAETTKLLQKLGVQGRILLVMSELDELVKRATNNLPNVKAVNAKNVTVYDIMNADQVIISQKALPLLSESLASSNGETK